MIDPRDPDSGADIRGLAPGTANVVQQELRQWSPESFAAPSGFRSPNPKYDEEKLQAAYARQKYMAEQVRQRVKELEEQEQQDAHACNKQPGSVGLATSRERAG